MSRIVPFVLAASAYFIIGKLGLQFAFLHESASAIWPATGLALALLLIHGLRLWPAIFVGAFFVNVTTAGGVVGSLLIASGNALEALVGAWLVCRYANGRHAFERPGDVVKMWFLACMLATSLSATMGVASLCLVGDVSWANYGNLWRTWWLGDAVGGFIGSALILLWTRDPHVEGSRPRVLETVVVFTAVTVFSLLVFHNWMLNRAFYVLPLLLWAAFRLGRRETAGAILVLGIIGAWSTMSGRGPFANQLTTPNDALLLFQSYLAVLAVTNLTVASVVAERGQGVAKLRAAHDELEQRVHERTVMLSTANNALREEITERQHMEARLMAAERERGDAMRDLAKFVQEAQEEERQRISRELHDDLGQRLAALKMSMQVFEQDVSQRSDPYRARVHALVTDVDTMIAEVRRLSYNLRPIALDDFGLTVALEMLCKEFERLYKGTTTLYVSDSLPTFRDPQVDIALYRIAQGALSNVAKHAGAHHVSVGLVNDDASVSLSIEDDGRGFDVKSQQRKRDGRSGLGLVGMRERSELLGGSFHIESRVNEGTKVAVRIPVAPSSEGTTPSS